MKKVEMGGKNYDGEDSGVDRETSRSGIWTNINTKLTKSVIDTLVRDDDGSADLVLDDIPVQLDLFGNQEKKEKLEKLDRTVDEIRRRFGYFSIQRAVMYQDKVLSHLADFYIFGNIRRPNHRPYEK